MFFIIVFIISIFCFGWARQELRIGLIELGIDLGKNNARRTVLARLPEPVFLNLLFSQFLFLQAQVQDACRKAGIPLPPSSTSDENTPPVSAPKFPYPQDGGMSSGSIAYPTSHPQGKRHSMF